MSTLINPDKLAELDQITLDRSSHSSFDAGHCSMEVVSWLADLGHTDAPSCSSPVLTRFVIRLNDRWDFEQRQKLKPFLPRLVGTAGDGKDELREQVATWYAVDLLVPWLQLAGLDAEVESLRNTDDLPVTLYEVRQVAWSARSKKYQEIKAKVQEKLEKQPVAGAVAGAGADAGAVADAAAAAVAVAGAGAAAAADAVAAAVAVADYWDKYDAAYTAARDYYRKHPLPVSQQIADLAAEQDSAALDLLNKLIDPEVA